MLLSPQLTFFGEKEIGDHAPGPCATQAAGLHITPAAARWILRVCFRDISHGTGTGRAKLCVTTE